MNFFGVIFIGLTVGWFAGQLMTRKGFGMTGDLITGVIGALLGGALFEKAGIFSGMGFLGSLMVAATGALVFLYGVRLAKSA